MNDAPLNTLSQRCADGVLTDSERAELLRRLETNPAGFRPLALALMERRLIDAALRETTSSPPSPTPADALSRPTRPWRRAAGWAFSAAAGLAIGLGWHSGETPVAAPSSADGSAMLAGGSATAEPTPSRTIPAMNAPEAAVPPPTPVAHVEWPTGDGAPFSLPVYDEHDLSPAFAARVADPLSADVRAELIRAGRFGGEVRQEYTLPLADGRLLTIPVHAVRVRAPEVF